MKALLRLFRRISLFIFFLSSFLLTIKGNSQTLANFHCTVSVSEASGLTQCGSIVNFEVQLPQTGINELGIYFPNSFKVISINGGFQNGSGTVVDDPNSLPFGAFIEQRINQLTGNSIQVSLAYVNCNEYGEYPLNVNNLIFDCFGYNISGTSYDPSLSVLNPSGGNTLLDNLGGYVIANSSNLNPIILSPGLLNQHQAGLNATFDRTFEVKLNSNDITGFELIISQEDDLEYESLEIYDGTVSYVIDNFNYGAFNIFDLENQDISSLIIQNGSERKLQFRQRVTMLCNPNTPSEILARVECDCGNSEYFSSNNLPLNASIIESPSFEPLSTSFASSPPNSNTTFCSGTYELLLSTEVNGVTASIDEVIFPFNTQDVTINQIQIGNGADFSAALNYSTQTNSDGESEVVIPISDDQTNSQLTIPGINNTYNNQNGAWLDIPENSSLNLQIRVILNYNCDTDIGCENDVFRFFDDEASITYNMTGICGTSITQSQNITALSEQVAPTAAITGGCVDFNYVITQNPAPLSFAYAINLPSNIPFGLRLGNQVILNNCSDIGYRAFLSADFPLNYDLVGSITELMVNGEPSTYSPTNGGFIIDLPYNETDPSNLNSISLSFNLSGINCPNPSLSFGSINFVLRVEAFCNECPQCVQSLGCGSDILYVHCPGNCNSDIAISPDIQIARTTYGWLNQEAFENGDQPVVDPEDFGSNAELLSQRLYPFDLFSINANGWIQSNANKTHNALSFEINWSQLAAAGIADFSVVDYTLVMIPLDNQVQEENVIITDGMIVNIEAPENLAGFPPDVSMVPFNYTWSSNFLNNDHGVNLNLGEWNISLNLVLRFNPSNPVSGFYPIDMLCQFKSEATPASTSETEIVSSCDPYGGSLLLLIPEVSFEQAGVENGEISLGDGGEVVAEINDTDPCTYGHVVALRLSGGLGDDADDFPGEYRPLTVWPNSLAVDGLLELNDIYSGPESFAPIVGTEVYQNVSNSNNLLKSKEKGQIEGGNLLPAFQGLFLTLEKLCLTGGGVVPLELPINEFAYIHAGHLLDELPEQISPTEISIIGNVPCDEMNSFPGNGIISIPNGESTYSFTLSSPVGSENNPVAFRFEVLPNNGVNPDVTLGDFLYNGQSINSLNGWYIFPDGLPNETSSNASINLTLQEPNGCFGESFQIAFNWVAFCSPEKFNAFLTDAEDFSDNCFCEVVRTFRRGQSDLANAVITDEFESEGCDLVWNLNIENPPDQPTLVLSELHLNFITGLLFEGAEISSECNGVTTPLEDPEPLFELVQYQIPSVTFMSNTLISSDITIDPGCSIHYRIVMKVAQSVCDAVEDLTSSNILIRAFFEGTNICEEDIIPRPIVINTNQPTLLTELNSISQGTNCCIGVPSISVQHICPSSPGTVTISGIQGKLFSVYWPDQTIVEYGLQTENVWTQNFDEPVTFGIVVYDIAQDLYYSPTISVQNHSLTVNIPNVPYICEGNGYNITPILTPAISSSGIPYSFEWSTNETTSSIQIFPEENTNYNVDVSNGSCSADASLSVIVKPVPTVAPDGPLSFCSGQSLDLTASGGSTTDYTWSNESTGSNITVTTTGNYSVSDGYCNSLAEAFTFHPLPSSVISGPTSICQGASAQLSVPFVSSNTYAWTLNGNVFASTNSITITAGGTYQVTVTNNTTPACSTTASQTVVLNPLPTISASGALTFCEGGEITLSANAGTAPFTWPDGSTGNSFVATQSGSFAVTDANSCSSQSTVVNVNSLPNSTITASGPTTICQGESVQLTVPQVAGNTYTWTVNGTAIGNNTNTLTANQSNTYQVTVTSPLSCTSSSNTTVTVNETPTVSITGATSICEGESTVLTAQVLPPSASLQWTNGPNTSEFSNLQEGTYIVTATLEACTSSASAQVISLPRPDLPIFTQNVINACALESITLSPDNYTNNSNVTFQWSGNYTNGVNFGNPSAIEAVITNSGTFNLTTIATNGCEAVSEPIEVNLEAEYCSCACNGEGTNQVVPSNITTGASLQQFVESTASEGGCYYLSHDITITNGSSISISDASFVIAAGVEIYIEPGGSLALDGCQFSGCSSMWKGLRNFGILDMNFSYIQDAEYAIKLEKYASFNINNLPISTNVRNSTFLKNTFGIFSNSNHNTTHSFFIEKCQFIGNDLLPAYSSMQYWGEKSIAGICVSRINFTVQNNCLFRELQFGIIAHSSSVIVPNSTFENIRRPQGDHYYLHLYNFFHQMLNLSILNKPSSAAIFGSDSKLIIGKENPIDEALGNDFRGCFVGVFATRTSLIANNNRFSPSDLWSANTGFHIVQPGGNKYFRIDYNEMEVSDRGIFILSPNNLLQGGTYTANANVIRLVDRLPNESLIADNAAIFGIQISSVNQGNGIRLYSNEVLIESPYAKAFGIHNRGTNGIIVKGNIVNRNSDTKGSGFVLENSNGGILSCNSSTGVDFSIEDNYGYQTILSPASRLEGNNSYGTLIGFEYKMDNTGTNFERNTMNIHGDPFFTQTTGHGLRLSADNTIIGFQNYKWNRWIDAPTLFTEQAFKDLANFNINRFRYNPNVLFMGDYTFLPTRNQSELICTDDQFFNCLADPDNSTPPADNQYCTAPGSPINGRSVLHSALQLANDSIAFPYYNDESVYELKRSIYAMQEKEGVILPDSANLDILKQEIDASNIPKFFKVDDLLSKSVLDSTTAQQWAETDSLLSLKERELTELEYLISSSDSTLAISLNATREALLFEIDNYKSIINTYLETYESESEAKKDSIEERNSEITPDRYMETLDKQMNTLFLTSIDSAFVDFSISEQQQIEAVASLCPLIGGAAVFKARTLLLLFNDTLFFDDKKICGLEGLAYRKANTNSQFEEIAEQSVQLFPNPTNGILNGSFTIVPETSYQLRMYNTLGQLVFEKQIVGQTWEINLKSLNFQSGIYFTELSALDGSNTFKNRVVYVSE